MDALLTRTSRESEILDEGETALKALIATTTGCLPNTPRQSPEWGPAISALCRPLAAIARRVSVWAPGQGTPVHNHTVGVGGVLRGEELLRRISWCPRCRMRCQHEHRPPRGDVDRVTDHRRLACGEQCASPMRRQSASMSMALTSVASRAACGTSRRSRSSPSVSGYERDTVDRPPERRDEHHRRGRAADPAPAPIRI